MSDEKNLNDDFNEAVNDAKESAKDFGHEAEKTLSDAKNVAIIAHITLIGWIIALVMNSNKKSAFGSFYIRQMLGFIILSFVGFIPIIGWVFSLVLFVAWIMSLVTAAGGTMKPSFLLGNQFQEWFKSI
ncbi:YtxH domain-containing protein [Confluentibacter citreus]|uniref:YtxH domain-containing protein n=1 Tax=Confluentibacter citreus TaxID=2007307 RepID=UPI001EFCF67B|nr:YtxH domain-containing protein [Confluentibacter citreus]